ARLQVADAACRVVGCLDAHAQLSQAALALRQRLRVRAYHLDLVERRAGVGNQAVLDVKLRLANDVQRVPQQQVVVAVDAPRQRVLDGDQPQRRVPRLDACKHLVKRAVGDGFSVRQQAAHGHLGVGPSLALKGHAHRRLAHGRRSSPCSAGAFSTNRSTASATPSSLFEPTTTSAAAFATSVAFATATPRPASLSISTAFSPSPMAITSPGSMPSSASSRRSAVAFDTPAGMISSIMGTACTSLAWPSMLAARCSRSAPMRSSSQNTTTLLTGSRPIIDSNGSIGSAAGSW